MHRSSFINMERFALKYLKNYKNKKLKIIDIGSQDINGSYRSIFENYNWQYCGCDMTEGKNVDIILNNEYNWNEVKSGSFDVVISGQAFEHIEYFWVTMLEISRILKEEGLCCIIAPSGGIEHKYPIDCWRFYSDGMETLSKYAGLHVVEAYTQSDGKDFPDYDPEWKDSVLICQKPKRRIIEKLRFLVKNKLSKLILKL